jgi:hypothetical protein
VTHRNACSVDWEKFREIEIKFVTNRNAWSVDWDKIEVN